MRYSFDTSAFINGRREVLPSQTFQAFWANTEGLIARGELRAVDVVRDELDRRDDATKEWARTQAGLFVPLDLDLQLATRAVLRTAPRLVGKGGTRNGADPFVIALALVNDGSVVSEEQRTSSPTRPHIPDVCDALGVPCLRLVEFAAEHGPGFVQQIIPGS